MEHEVAYDMDGQQVLDIFEVEEIMGSEYSTVRKKVLYLIHHERAQIPYSDITGMYLAPDIKISSHIHGRLKRQIGLKLPCFLIPIATISNFLHYRTLTDTKYMASSGLLCWIQCAEACDRHEG